MSAVAASPDDSGDDSPALEQTIEPYVPNLIGALAPTEAGLLGLWAMCGKQGWRWRLLGVMAGDALLIAVRAAGSNRVLLGRLCGAIVSITIMVFAIGTVMQFLRREMKVDTSAKPLVEHRFNFSIVQLLLATAGVALLAYLWRLVFYRDPGFAPAVVVAITLAADWATRANRHRCRRVCAVFALALTLGGFRATMTLFGFSRIGELAGPAADLYWSDLLALSTRFQLSFCANASLALATLWILRYQHDGITPAARPVPSADDVMK